MYYYNDGENEVGPFSLDKLKTLNENGLIGSGTLIRSADSISWLPFSQIIGVERLEIRGNEKAKRDSSGDGNDKDLKSAFTKYESAEALQGGAASTQAIEEEITEAEDSEPAPCISPSGWLVQPPTPWRRFAARYFDTMFNGIIGFFLLGLIFYAIAPNSADSFFSILGSPSGQIVSVLMVAVVSSIIGGALIGATGFTLGKQIFGVKVTRLDGRKLGLAAGWSRDFSALIKGLGLFIPIVSLVTMLTAFRTLKDSGSTSWDKERYITWHRPNGGAQYFLNVVGIALIFAMIGLSSFLDAL